MIAMEAGMGLVYLRKLTGSVFISFLLAASATSAESDKTRAVSDFAYNVCVKNVHDLGNIANLAEVGGWKPLPAELAQAFEPRDVTEFAGWEVKFRNVLMMLVVSHWKADDGKAMNTCMVVVSTFQEPFLEEIRRRIDFKKVDSRAEGKIRFDEYLFTNPIGLSVIMELMYFVDSSNTRIKFILVQKP